MEIETEITELAKASLRVGTGKRRSGQLDFLLIVNDQNRILPICLYFYLCIMFSLELCEVLTRHVTRGQVLACWCSGFEVFV